LELDLPWFDKENRRGATRHRYDGNNAWVGLDGSLVRRCQIINLSRTGVRLAVTNADSLPNKFTLILSKNSRGRPARVKWRCGNEIGAEFFGAYAGSGSRLAADTPKANSSSISRLDADAPKANSSSASRLGADGLKANTGSRLTADAPGAVSATRGKGKKTEKPVSNLSLQARGQQRQGRSSLKTDARKFIGSITHSSRSPSSNSTLSEQRDQVDQGNTKKKSLDLSRLRKKLGPNHIALIHALKEVDPDSPHGRELASIIESLEETSD
jgi:hypothetical protein